MPKHDKKHPDSRLPLFMNWSSGKDASLALYRILQEEKYEVRYLLTSMNATHDRVTMHGLRRSLLEQQLRALKIPSLSLELPEQPDMDTYGNMMRQTLGQLQKENITHAAFGDIFLEDLKEYREGQLAEVGFQAVFPLWKEDTRKLLEEFIALGFQAIVLCVDATLLGERFLGRTLDADFLRDLPEGVDPCGENGEFHTFCFDGPIFEEAIRFTKGERVLRTYPDPSGKASEEKGFWFLDLLPA